MPGYYIHLAASNSKNRGNKKFIKGIIMPDLLKDYYRMYGFSETKKKYEEIKINGMPDFSFFEQRVQEKPKENTNEGLHYGTSADPNIHLFWNSLTNEQKNNPFFRGYLWHLLTDLYIDQMLGLEFGLNLELLHSDWDNLNTYIKTSYPLVKLPKEVIDLNIISYKNDNTFNYVNPNNIKKLIDFLNRFNVLKENPDEIIVKIINEINKDKE